MRILTFFGVVCMGLAMAGCSADQPLDASSVGGGASDTLVQVQATASVPVWNVWNWTEDANGNGQLDNELDRDHDNYLDTGEDLNHNGVLDPGEDRNANGRLNFDEDFMLENGLLDRRPGDTGVGSCPACEDVNLNCQLDAGEDLNGDGILASEDVDCDGQLDGINEDTNHNGIRDFEDTVDANGSLDAGVWCEDSGLPSITGNVPVPIAGDVLLYHQGNPTPVVLASEPNLGGGLTPYDVRVFATFPTKTVTLESGSSLTVTQGQQLAAGATRLAFAPQAKSPGTPGNAGLCTVNLGFGQPNLGGVPLPITTQTAPGDTITIRVQSKPALTFNMIAQAVSYAVGATVTKNGVQLAPQGAPFADLGQPVSFHVAVP
jgi:hypothetical protein